jgi:enoyl-CoA hydratase
VGEIEIGERTGGVRVVRLNRPDRLNALTPDMVRLITEAAEIMVTNRHVHAAEALSIGLVTELAAPDDLETATSRLAEAIVSLSPFGQKMTKQVYRANADASSLEEALQLENRTQILASATADAAEARAAFLEKRRPNFTGR